MPNAQSNLNQRGARAGTVNAADLRVSMTRAIHLAVSPQPGVTAQASAEAAGLRYVAEAVAGIRRLGRSRFRYVDTKGVHLRDPATLARIRGLVVPPAWANVWICEDPQGHLQATGIDAKGRKQYRYHEAFRQQRDSAKYHRMIEFGNAIPRIRTAVARALALPGLPRAKILATLLRLLELTWVRVGNEEYARQNHSFGLTTLRNKHVHVAGNSVNFRFRGKSGKEHTVDIHDRRIARIVRQCEELPGQHLFEYVDAEGRMHVIESADVNQYIRLTSAGDFTAKDFRTLAAR